jgi:hypothetical protein
VLASGSFQTPTECCHTAENKRHQIMFLGALDD